MNKKNHYTKNKAQKQYETDHSYFLTYDPRDTVVLDEDMALNASNTAKKDD